MGIKDGYEIMTNLQHANAAYLKIVETKTALYKAKNDVEAITHEEYRKQILSSIGKAYDELDRAIETLKRMGV